MSMRFYICVALPNKNNIYTHCAYRFHQARDIGCEKSRGECVNDIRTGRRRGFSVRLRTIAVFVVLMFAITQTLIAVMAQGPHIETPRNVVLNEMKLASSGWVELVNPTNKDVYVKDWKVQKLENEVWTTMATVSQTTLEKWNSGNQYLVMDITATAPSANTSVRLVDDTGAVIDCTVYKPLNPDQSWARYTQHNDRPASSDSGDDWYVSSDSTKGYQNDKIYPSV